MASNTLPGWRAATNIIDDSTRFVQTLYRQLFVLGFLILLGATLDAVRIELIWMSPWVTKHYSTITKAWNVIGEILSVVMDFIELAIGEVIKALQDLHVLRSIHSKIGDHGSFVTVATVTHDFDEIFIYLPGQCSAYSSASDMIRGAFDRVAGEHVCYVMRALYPTRLQKFSDRWFGKLLNGRQYVPSGYTNGDGSCTQVEVMNWLCIPFGAGVVILEIIVPLMLTGIVLLSFRHVIFEDLLGLCVAPVKLAGDVAIMGIKESAKLADADTITQY